MISIYARIAAVAALLVLLAGIGWRIDQGGYKRSQNERTAELLVMSENARLREQAAQKTNERIDHEYQTAKTRLAADKRISDDRLREFQTAVSADTDTSTTDGDYGDPRSAIITECAGTAVVLDEAAKRMASQTKALQQFIGEVCLAK